LLFTLGASVYTGLVEAWIAHYAANQAALEQKRLELSKLSRLVDERLDEHRQKILQAAASQHLQAASQDAALVAAQSWVRGLADQAGLAVSALDGTILVDDSNVATLSINVQFAAPLGQSQRFFQAVEYGDFPARIERLTIRRRADMPGNASASGEASLDIQIGIVTWYPIRVPAAS